MNHHDNNKNGKNKKHNPIKHVIMMVLCCGLPLLILSILSFISIGEGVKTVISGIVPFICPIMMIFMIPMMVRAMKNGDCCGKNKEVNENQKKIE